MIFTLGQRTRVNPQDDIRFVMGVQVFATVEQL